MSSNSNVSFEIKPIKTSTNLFQYLLSILIFSQVPASFLAFESGIANRQVMIYIRAFTMLLSVILIIIGKSSLNSIWIITTSSFWLFYILRLLVDVVINGFSLAIPPWELAAWGLGASAIPAMAVYSLARRTSKDLNPFILVLSGTLALGLSAIYFSTNFNIFFDRFLLPDLNPIPAGHAGTSLFLISLSSLLYSHNIKSKHLHACVKLIGVFIGLFITLSSSTRSAFTALLVGLFLILFIYNRSKKLRSRIITTSSSAFIVLTSYFILGGSGLKEKVNTLGQGASELNRLTFASSSLNAWLEKPWFGQGFKMHEIIQNLFVDLNHYYPHNFIIESFLLGGLLLGGLIIFHIIFTSWTTIRLIILSKEDIWLACLWIQSLCYVMFSGHLGNVPIFWISSAAICGRYESLKSNEPGDL